MALASGGGHWVQLRRLRPAFDGFEMIWVTTRASLGEDVDDGDFRLVPEANRWHKWRLVRCAIAVAFLLLRTRPDVIVTTGAAPGYLAIRFGRLLGAHTIWIDSIANADELSLSGEKALRQADVCFTQWSHLAGLDGPRYEGTVFG